VKASHFQLGLLLAGTQHQHRSLGLKHSVTGMTGQISDWALR
jgi:hypothetical protein